MPHVVTAPRTYTIDALTAEGFTPRQIRGYVHSGMLPRAYGHAPYGHYYSDIHLAVLRKIRECQDQNRSIEDISEMIALDANP